MEGLTGIGHEEPFWSGGNVLYLVLGGDYMSEHKVKTHQNGTLKIDAFYPM